MFTQPIFQNSLLLSLISRGPADVAAEVEEVAEVAEPEVTEVAEVSSIQMMLLKRKMMTKGAPRNQQTMMALLLPCLQ